MAQTAIKPWFVTFGSDSLRWFTLGDRAQYCKQTVNKLQIHSACHVWFWRITRSVFLTLLYLFILCVKEVQVQCSSGLCMSSSEVQLLRKKVVHLTAVSQLQSTTAIVLDFLQVVAPTYTYIRFGCKQDRGVNTQSPRDSCCWKVGQKTGQTGYALT